MREQQEHHGIKGGILHLEMGMGKTLISLIYCLLNRRENCPSLIVVPVKLIHNWQNEVKKFIKPE